MNRPLVVAVAMGYGHLRPAHALARMFDVPLHRMDEPPMASGRERGMWNRTRAFYEATTRASQLDVVGFPLRRLVHALTHIAPLHPSRDQSAPNVAVRWFDRLVADGFGRGLVDALQRTNAPLVTTFYAPAIVADRAGVDRVLCVVTDTDINRIWVPHEPAGSLIRYAVPSRRAAERLRAYGVDSGRIHVTGFPLPHELLGGPERSIARRNFVARLARLDPDRTFRDAYRGMFGIAEVAEPAEESGPPLLTFSVGGAGAQGEIARAFLPHVGDALEHGRLRLALVAGSRADVAERFFAWVREAGLEPLLGDRLTILHERDVETYFDRFDALLARTDVLWTKPSELSFYAALGIPILLAPAVGAQEEYNRRWLLEHGAAIEQRDPRYVARWLEEQRDDGVLARAAWSGFTRLPQLGLYRIRDLVLDSPPETSRERSAAKGFGA